MSQPRLAACTISDARRFIGTHHRHNLPPRGGLFATSVEVDGRTVAVGVAGRPVARGLQDGTTIEIVRCCTDSSTPNTASMIYGALARAAKALGYSRAITYTLASESGASLRASNWRPEAKLPRRAGWNAPTRGRAEQDLFGNDRTPREAKVRWVLDLYPRRGA